MSVTHALRESLSDNSFDSHEALAIGPRRIDQLHLVECQPAAFHNSFHLALFRQ
jgi:hypothetical protein